VLHLLPATASCMNLVQKNQFPELNRHILTFSQYILLSGVYILSTGGDAPQMLGEFLCSCYNLLVPGFLETKEPLIPRFLT